MVPLVVVFMLAMYNPIDADLGWHLKLGEYFVEHGQILKENVFSSGLPGYQWVNISWATDVVDYLVFHYLGFFGLTILSAITITLGFYMFDKTFSPPDWLKLIYPLSIWIGYHTFAYAFRGQVVSFLFLGILVCQLWLYGRKPSKKIYWLVPLFTVWANMHGQFIVGLGVLVGWVIFQLVRKFNWQLVWLVGSCFLATLVHPFGLQIYSESLAFFNNPTTKLIIEWLPPEVAGIIWWKLIAWTILLSSGVVMYWSKKDKQVTPFVVLSLVFTVLSFSSRRYITSLIVVTLPIMLIYFGQLKFGINKLIKVLTISGWVVLATVMVPVNLASEDFFQMSWKVYCEKYFDCSLEGVEYVKSHDLTEDILTPYTWGGWLIWNYPEIKPFTDGRMNLWQKDGVYPFKETVDFENGNRHVDDSTFKTVFIGRSTPLFFYISQLPNWKQVYADERSGVFVRE